MNEEITERATPENEAYRHIQPGGPRKAPAGAQAPDPDAREAANQTQPPENNRQPRAGPQESREARANELFRLFGSQCLKWNCPRRVPRGPAAPS